VSYFSNPLATTVVRVAVPYHHDALILEQVDSVLTRHASRSFFDELLDAGEWAARLFRQRHLENTIRLVSPVP